MNRKKGKGSYDRQMKQNLNGGLIVQRVGHYSLDRTASATSQLVEEPDWRGEMEILEQ